MNTSVTKNALLLITAIAFSHKALASGFDIKESLYQFEPSLSTEFKANLALADIKVGAQYFDRKCAQCHDGQQNGGHSKGPHLWNWFARQAGTIEAFEFSPAMKKSTHQWDFATLNYYLTRTDRAIPGVDMNFRGIRQDQKRANLLAYMRSLNDVKPDLPSN